MVTLYRSASYLRRRYSWTKAVVAKSVWVFLELEDRLHFLCFSKMFLSFVLAVLVIPWTAVFYLTLKVHRLVLSTVIRQFFRNYTVIDSQSVRCALDTRRNPGIVTLLLSLAETIDLTELRRCILRDVVEQKTDSGLLAFPNLKKRVKYKLGCYLSQPDEQFAIENHVIAADARWKGRAITEANIQSYIGEVNSRPLPGTISPWQMVLVNMQSTDIRSDVVYIVVRIHPVISEGLSLDRAFGDTILQLSSPTSQTASSVAYGSTSAFIQNSSTTLMKFAASPSSDPPPPPSKVESVDSENCDVPFLNRSYTVFCHNSATRDIVQQLAAAMRTTWREFKLLCDTSRDPPEHLSAGWRCLRSFIASGRHVQHEFDKWCDRATMSDRGALWWSLRRAVLFIYFVPIFLYRPDVTAVVSFAVRKSLWFGLCVPWWYVRCCWMLGRSLNDVLAEVRLFAADGRPFYVTVKRSVGEMRRTAVTAFAAPSLIWSEFTQRDMSESYPWLRRSGSCRKVVSWSQPLSLELVRKVKQMTEAKTVNEVLISVCAGCLTHYLKHIGVEVPSNIAATMPVCFKPFAQADEFGTDGFLTLSLPTGDADNLCRLGTIKRRMQRNRCQPAKFLLSVFLLRYSRLFLSDGIMAMILKFLSRNYPLTLNNISLPASSVFSVGGRQVQSMYYWRPPQANTALTLSLITYNNQVSLVAMSAQDIVPQTQIITEHFVKEFNCLACALGIRLEKQSLHHQETSSQKSASPSPSVINDELYDEQQHTLQSMINKN